MDLGRVAQYFTLDAITKISYGYAFGYLANNEDVHGYIETTEKMVPFLNLCATLPILQKITGTSQVRRMVGPGFGDQRGLGKMMGY